MLHQFLTTYRMLFSSQDVIFRHCNYRYFVTMVCALLGIAQMTHFYVTRWGDGGGGQTILEYVLSRRTFSKKQCFSHWAIIVLWFNSWMKVKYHINKVEVFEWTFARGGFDFFLYSNNCNHAYHAACNYKSANSNFRPFRMFHEFRISYISFHYIRISIYRSEITIKSVKLRRTQEYS